MEIVHARGWPHELEVSFRLEKGYVTPNCMGRAVRQFEKEVSFKPEERVENVTSNCMGRAVCQFDKEVSFLKTRNRSRICYIELYGKPRPPVRKGSKFYTRNRSRIGYIELYETRRPPVRKELGLN